MHPEEHLNAGQPESKTVKCMSLDHGLSAVEKHQEKNQHWLRAGVSDTRRFFPIISN